MSAQHTPGPWMIDRLTCKGQNGYHWVIQTHEGDEGFEVAKVFSQWTPERDDEISEANARLIAAAPDLLEALRACVSQDPSNWQDMARAAIAKAGGAR